MEPDSDFFVAIEAGDLLSARAMLAADPNLVHAFNGDGATALHIAAFRSHRELVDVLCAAGADMNARDNRFGATPAGWALHYLRERGAFLAIEIEDLLYAIESHDLDWTRRLIERHPHIIATKDASGRARRTRPRIPHSGNHPALRPAALIRIGARRACAVVAFPTAPGSRRFFKRPHQSS